MSKGLHKRFYCVITQSDPHTQDFTAGTNTQKHLKDTIFTDMLLLVILNVINARGAVCCYFVTRSEGTNPDYINCWKIKLKILFTVCKITTVTGFF